MSDPACSLCGRDGGEIQQNPSLTPYCSLSMTPSMTVNDSRDDTFGSTWQEQIANRAFIRVMFGGRPDEAINGAVAAARKAGYPMPPKPTVAIAGESRIERIKRAVSVQDVASRLTALRPAGRDRLRGLCPLHRERTPSFYVFVSEGRWHCFGACSRGGDVIDLWQEAYGEMPNDA